MSGKRISKSIVIGSVVCLWLTAAGCFGGHHRLVLMHRFKRHCIDAPPIAEVPFHGYHGTCWEKWPEGWVACPEYTVEESEVVAPPEAMPTESMLDEPMVPEPMPDEPLPMEPAPPEPTPPEPMPPEPTPPEPAPSEPPVPMPKQESPPTPSIQPPMQDESPADQSSLQPEDRSREATVRVVIQDALRSTPAHPLDWWKPIKSFSTASALRNEGLLARLRAAGTTNRAATDSAAAGNLLAGETPKPSRMLPETRSVPDRSSGSKPTSAGKVEFEPISHTEQDQPRVEIPIHLEPIPQSEPRVQVNVNDEKE